MFYQHLKKHVEALLFVAGNPVSVEKLAEILAVDSQNILRLLEDLKNDMRDENRGLTIAEVAGGYQLCTKPELASTIEKLGLVRETRLSMAALETLAIVAFKQPVTRQEIEKIRGVNVDRVMNTLLERGLIKEVGRKEVVGRPILYGTTDEFLVHFGLNSLEELQKIGDLLLAEQL